MSMGRDATLGSIVRRIRAANGWTLAEMSRRVEIPLSTLAKVEHNRLTLSYDKLLQMSARLDMRLSDLLSFAETGSSTSATARRSIGKLPDAVHIATMNYDYHYLCTELRNKLMIPIFCRVRAKSREEFGNLVRHRGEEFIYVVEGTIEVHTEFYDPVVLKVGESHYLDSEMPHAYLVGAGCDEAVVISVCASRENGLQQELVAQARAEAVRQRDAPEEKSASRQRRVPRERKAELPKASPDARPRRRRKAAGRG